MYKKILASLIVLISTNALATEDLIPLKQYLKERKDWVNDISEVAYIGTRCTALYFLVGAYFEDNGLTEDNLKQGKRFLDGSKIYKDSSLTLSIKNKMSIDKFTARYASFLDLYGKKMQSNKRLQNNIFVDYILDDIEVCDASFPFYIEIDKQINDTENPNNSK